jgi:hypothetical protein
LVANSNAQQRRKSVAENGSVAAGACTTLNHGDRGGCKEKPCATLVMQGVTQGVKNGKCRELVFPA